MNDIKEYVNTKLSEFVKERGFYIDDQGTEFLKERKRVIKEYHDTYGMNKKVK